MIYVNNIANLFREDLVFFENAKTREELFNNIGTKLVEMELVKPTFIPAIKEREKNYPTGLDLGVVGTDTPNVAIPHTEAEHCNADQIVVVKLLHDIQFNNMISPDKIINVRFAFFILNSQKSEQPEILSNLMGFFTQGQNMKKLDQLKTPSEVYQYILQELN